MMTKAYAAYAMNCYLKRREKTSRRARKSFCMSSQRGNE
jgi:hypothetical protein